MSPPPLSRPKELPIPTAQPRKTAPSVDPRLAKVLKALAKDPRYVEVLAAYAAAQAGPRQGFGSDALRIQGKIFCMVTSRAEFVVKLPKVRVAELVKAKRGRHFDANKGKPMKEWFVATAAKAGVVALAKEAFEAAEGGTLAFASGTRFAR